MKPVLQALLLAERVYEDRSGKKIIAGTFNELEVARLVVKQVEGPDGKTRRQVPGGGDPGCPWVYLSLTDVIDGTKLTLQIVNVAANKPLFQTGVAILKADRLATVEITLALPPFREFVHGPGILSVDLVWEDEILGSHRLRVKEKAATEQEGCEYDDPA